MTEVIGIVPDYVPDEDFIPGPLPLLSEGFLSSSLASQPVYVICMYCPGAMSLFTLLYVAPILGIIYYLFFWSRGRPTGGACVSALHNGYSSGGRVKMFLLSQVLQKRSDEIYQELLNTRV